MSNTKTIARNSGWYSIETIVNLVVVFATNIAIARTLGPSKMGYMVFINTLTGFASLLGGIGLPQTARKFMAEFIGKGDRGTARFIYIRTMALQTALATLATATVLVYVLRDATSEYKIAAALLVISTWPAMINFISAQANAATEELQKNLPASMISILVFGACILATVVLKWGVIGVGVATLAMRSMDFIVRLIPTMRRVLSWEKVHLLPDGVSRRMTSFAWQSVATLAVALVVWNRSEVFLLKKFCPDINQIAFYSVAFSMAEMLLIGSSIFGLAVGTTIFAQFGRDKSRLPDIAGSSFRYLALTAIPLHVIAAALAPAALHFLYGAKYDGAAVVVMLAPILCMPKAFITPVQNLLESMERQRYIILATAIAGIADLSVAWFLIRSFSPGHGAVGACIGSGAAQILAVGTMWAIGIYLYKVTLPWMQLIKIASISALASLTAHFIAMRMTPLLGILCGGTAALTILFGLYYVLRVLEPQDSLRLKTLTGMLPKAIGAPANAALTFLARHSDASGISLIE
ncbi:MAG: oligosaccharide flippase family protein [Terracidiphilus sp.]|jgi:O-antigen/teichoic acid export membrane protein